MIINIQSAETFEAVTMVLGAAKLISPTNAPAHYGWKQLENVLFDPAQNIPDASPTSRNAGSRAATSPVIDHGFFDRDAKKGWEQMAFVSLHSTVGKLDLYVYLRMTDAAGTTKRQYFHLRVGEEAEPIGAAAFFRQLLVLNRYWHRVIREAMQIEVPEQRVIDASEASLVRALITYDGSAPRYGVGHYAAAQHATFPPATLSTVNACTEWALFERARRYLDYYLDRVVRDDGTSLPHCC